MARRRRDPRLPGPMLEDVSTTVGGELVASYELSETDALIATAHQDALDEVRTMWGLDRDDWLIAAEELTHEHPELAKIILCRWCDISIEAQKHDSRAPEAYGWIMLADLYHRAGDHGAEHDTLREWTSYWGEGRGTTSPDKPRIVKRLEAGCGLRRPVVPEGPH